MRKDANTTYELHPLGEKHKNMKSTYYIIFILIFFIGTGCKDQKHPSKTVQDPGIKKVSIQIPVFNEDSAYLFVKNQVDFGPRVPNTSAHSRCASYLIEKLKSYTPHVIEQSGKVRTYNALTLNCRNIIASFQPEKQSRVFLAAHWDSRPYADHDPDPSNHKTPIDGANDGASGVGVLLEIARHLSLSEPVVGVDIILFDVEDYGPPQDSQVSEGNDFWGLGSQYWSRNPHVPGYMARYGILLDMVGAENARFPQEAFSKYYAPDILKKVWKKAHQLGYNDYFLYEDGSAINDDHYYVNKIRKIPTIDIIHLDPASANGSFFEYWHTVNDNMSVIDKFTLKIVGQTVMAVVYEER